MFTRTPGKEIFVIAVAVALVVLLIAPLLVFPLAHDAVSTLVAGHAAAFRRIEPLAAREQASLRTFRNAEHLAVAESLGVDGIRTREIVDSLVQRNVLVPLESNRFYFVQSMKHSVPYVTPGARATLDRLGARFQAALEEQGLPPVRFIISSGLRTRTDQAALTRVNPNAATTRSSHEFGTTVDILYSRFRTGPVEPELPWYLSPFRGYVSERLESRYEIMAKRHRTPLKAVLGRVLEEMQARKELFVIYERVQPVYHVTTAGAPATP